MSAWILMSACQTTSTRYAGALVPMAWGLVALWQFWKINLFVGVWGASGVRVRWVEVSAAPMRSVHCWALVLPAQPMAFSEVQPHSPKPRKQQPPPPVWVTCMQFYIIHPYSRLYVSVLSALDISMKDGDNLCPVCSSMSEEVDWIIDLSNFLIMWFCIDHRWLCFVEYYTASIRPYKWNGCYSVSKRNTPFLLSRYE